MGKRIIYIESAGKLKIKDEQLTYERFGGETSSVPAEDVSVLIIDNHSVVLTRQLLTTLCGNNSAMIVCDNKHMPAGLMLPFSGNVIQGERLKMQINISEAKQGNLWKQIIISKIKNQAKSLVLAGGKGLKLNSLARKVRTGDPDNLEGRAARYYWQNIFTAHPGFTRQQEGEPPNHLLNFGYAVLRSITARALTGAGLNPSIGIHHANRYNPFALADDMMEPYRPFIDNIVIMITKGKEDYMEITKPIKEKLLSAALFTVKIGERNYQLQDAVQLTVNSLVNCFSGKTRKLTLPGFADVDKQI